MKTTLTLEIDCSKAFDAVVQAGQEAAGARLLDLLLTVATGRSPSMAQCLTLEGGYGITVKDCEPNE
jgi:hypothetical protein